MSELRYIGMEPRPMPQPTPEDLDNPVFNAIWQTIKSWDVNVPDYYEGYCGATGSHVMLIMNAIRDAMLEKAEKRRAEQQAESEKQA